jgi:hypothetical protein
MDAVAGASRQMLNVGESPRWGSHEHFADKTWSKWKKTDI